MPTFEYKGYDHAGQAARGLIEALDLKDAREKLTHQGVLPEWVQAAGNARTWVWRRRDLTFQLDARAVFYRELASILGAGLPLSQALALLMDAPEMGRDRAVIAGIRDRVSEGVSMAQAVGQASTRVTTFEQALLETGERAGQLDEVLNRLAGFLEEERALRDRLITASMYPAIILVLSALVGYGMLTFMLPAFRELLLESGLDLPFITRALLRVGSLLTYAFPVMVLVGIALGLGWRNRWRTDETFRIQWDRRSYKWPGYGSFYSLLVNVRFTRTLALLLQSGVPLLEALSQSGRASGSPWVATRVDKEAEQVRQGEKLSDALARVIPLAKTLPGWIRAGEASGDLTGMLNQAALRSQQVWDRRVTRAMTTIESALVILVGLAVFVLALSIILPILSLNQALQ